MKRNVFVYGLLQHPKVLQPLIGYVPKISSATLADHTRRVLIHDDFEPCAVAVYEPGQVIEGKILHDVCPRALKHMDVFECVTDGIYQRQAVRAALSCGQSIEGDVYLNGPSLKSGNIGDFWNQEVFNDRYMDYVLTELVPKYANY